jgi:hypothetical protein
VREDHTRESPGISRGGCNDKVIGVYDEVGLTANNANWVYSVEDEQGHTPTVTIGDEDVSVGQLGSYVAVKQNDVHLIAIVTRMSEQEALAAPTIETPGDDTARLPFGLVNTGNNM